MLRITEIYVFFMCMTRQCPSFFPEFIRILTQKFAPLRSKAVQIADFLPDSAPAASRRSAAFCLKKRIRFRLFCGIARTAEQNFVQIAN